MSKRLPFIVGLVCSVAVYQLPCLLTLAKTGWQPLPPVLVADQMLYLNVSAIHHVSATEVLNPWYGMRVLTVDVPHLMFPVTFQLFHFTHAIFGSWTAAMLAWNAFWTALTFLAGVFCLESFFPGTNRLWTSAGAFGLLVLQSPLIYVGEVRELLLLHRLLQVQLPYLRFAIPQVILPVVLAYWGMQVRALKSGSRAALTVMALLQFAEFTAFPYILPVLALGTGIAAVIAMYRAKEIALSWPAIWGYAAVCGVLDFGYLVLAGLGKSHANVHLALRFRPEMLMHEVRPYVVLLVAGAMLALFSRASTATIATAAGLGLSNAAFGFADAFFVPEAQMLQHPLYIVGITTWLPIFVFLWGYLEKFDRQWLRALVICGLAGVGVWEGFSSCQFMLSQNLFQAAAIKQVRPLNLTATDLMIAPSRFSDDISSWIPLLSPAKVLYTPDGENVLSAADTRTQQTFRQTLYLMMTGMNLDSLRSNTEPGSADARIGALLQQGDRTYAGSPLAKDRWQVRQELRERLQPVFAELEADPSAARNVLGGYRRIIVIDSNTNSAFDQSALSKWLVIEKAYEANGVNVYICTSKFPSDEKM
jgi:hypothetical protein